MNILFTVEHFHPYVSGAGEVVKHVAKGLVERGHRVSVATMHCPERRSSKHEGIEIAGFMISGNRVKGIRGEKDEYRRFLLNSRFDLIANYAVQAWHADLMFDVLDEIGSRKVLFPCGYSGLALWSKRIFYWNYYRKLPHFLRNYDHIIYHSSNYIDKAFGDRHGIEPYSVVPNGVSREEMLTRTIDFKKHYGVSTPFMLLNVSNHYKLKGHRFVMDAFRELDREDTTLVIIGTDIPGFRGCYGACSQQAKHFGKRVVLIEDCPRDHVVSAFHDADLFVFGSKVECFPLVVLESMATRTPFITTNVGSVSDLEGGAIVSSPKEMAHKIEGLINDSRKRDSLAAVGFETCMRDYTWERIVDRYEEIFLKLLDGSDVHPDPLPA